MLGALSSPQPGEAKNAAALAVGSKLKHLSLAETNLTMEIAQLLLSLLHAWGLDNDLDKARLSGATLSLERLWSRCPPPPVRAGV